MWYTTNIHNFYLSKKINNNKIKRIRPRKRLWILQVTNRWNWQGPNKWKPSVFLDICTTKETTSLN
jgi:hypothetical protein